MLRATWVVVDVGEAIDEQRRVFAETDDGLPQRRRAAASDGPRPRLLDRRQHGAQPRPRPVRRRPVKPHRASNLLITDRTRLIV